MTKNSIYHIPTVLILLIVDYIFWCIVVALGKIKFGKVLILLIVDYIFWSILMVMILYIEPVLILLIVDYIFWYCEELHLQIYYLKS